MSSREAGGGVRPDVAQLFEQCLVEIATGPPNAADRLLDVCCATLGASAGRLLSLAPESGELVVVAEQETHGSPGPVFQEKSLPAREYSDLPRREAISGNMWLSRVPAVREGTVVGAIELVADGSEDMPEQLFEAFARLLPLVRANSALRSGLRVIPPIPDAAGDESAFQARVYEYLDSHTRASLVAVFRVDNDLDVQQIFGPVGIEQQRWLQKPETLELVREAALEHGGMLIKSGLNSDGESPELAAVTLVATVDPISGRSSVGQEDDTYVLLAGFPIAYRPSAAEVAVFEHSLSIASYLHQVYAHVNEIAGNIGQVAEIGSAITGLETSQTARHHAKTEIDYAQHLVLDIRRNRDRTDEYLESLDVALRSIARDLDSVRDEMRAPDRDEMPTSLREMWDSARSLLQWRLARRRISIRYDGRDVQVVAAPDWFRQVFLNLLINSADAYDSADRRSGKITLRVHPFGDESPTVRMTYSDDATGIQPQHFLSCDVAPEVDLHERIFKPGVTSKEGGSGWGLYVCRSIVDHTTDASIDFVSARSGVTFDITMKRAGV